MRRRQWWVFDRPVLRDPLVVLAIAAAVVNVVLVLASELDGVARATTMLSAGPSAFIAVGLTGGLSRDALRARRRSP